MTPTTFAPEPEHVMELRLQLHRFVKEKAPLQKRLHWYREHTWPRELFREISEMGLIGLTIPAAYGGTGQDLVAAVAVIVELSQAGAFLS